AMFAEHNRPLLQTTLNENEYFIDRNGYIFYYILEFYRTGKIHFRENFYHQQYNSSVRNRYGFNGFGGGSRGIMGENRDNISNHPITHEELEEEMKYFQIPINTIWSSLTQRAIITKIDAFVDTLREVFYQVLGEFGSSIEIKFRRNKYQPQVKIREIEDDTMIFGIITNILKPYGSVGYLILDKFGTEIEHHMKQIIPELKWELIHIDNYNWYCIKMSTTEEIDHKEDQ
ncbi:1728_t:CDS:2, partial [Dentiscutata erythropus]